MSQRLGMCLHFGVWFLGSALFCSLVREVLMSCSLVTPPGVTVGLFDKSVLVFLRCGDRDRFVKSERATAAFGFFVDYSDCERTTNRVDARETALVLRWVIRNFQFLSVGRFDKVVFHHAHETSWHQKDLATQLVKLFSSSYFRKREYGEVYPHFLCHRMEGGHVPYRGFDLLDVLSSCLNETSFERFNRSKAEHIWLSGSNTGFFVSARSLTHGHTLADYKRMLENVHSTVLSMARDLGLEGANYYVGEVFERSWTVLFTNKTTADISMPISLGKLSVSRFDPICPKVRSAQSNGLWRLRRKPFA